MNTFYVEYVGEGDDFPVAKIEAWTAKEAQSKFVDSTGIDPFRITDIRQANVRQRTQDWDGMS